MSLFVTHSITDSTTVMQSVIILSVAYCQPIHLTRKLGGFKVPPVKYYITNLKFVNNPIMTIPLSFNLGQVLEIRPKLKCLSLASCSELSNKHSRLVQKIVNCGQKSFVTLATGANVLKLFKAVIYERSY
jgi:hypothetical protein